MPVINYEPGINWTLPDAPLFRAVHGHACPRCGDYFIHKTVETFFTDAGAGCTFEVSNACGLCPACFNRMKSHATDTKPILQVSKVLYTEHIFMESGTFTDKQTFEGVER